MYPDMKINYQKITGEQNIIEWGGGDTNVLGQNVSAYTNVETPASPQTLEQEPYIKKSLDIIFHTCH